MKLFEGNNFAEFRERVESKDIEVAEAIYGSIKQGYNKREDEVTAFEFKEKGSSNIYGFSLSREQWDMALNTCLDIYTEQELYEECTEIKNLINSLSYENGKEGYNKKKRSSNL
jgi:hypothetical protein